MSLVGFASSSSSSILSESSSVSSALFLTSSSNILEPSMTNTSGPLSTMIIIIIAAVSAVIAVLFIVICIIILIIIICRWEIFQVHNKCLEPEILILWISAYSLQMWLQWYYMHMSYSGMKGHQVNICTVCINIEGHCPLCPLVPMPMHWVTL